MCEGLGRMCACTHVLLFVAAYQKGSLNGNMMSNVLRVPIKKKKKGGGICLLTSHLRGCMLFFKIFVHGIASVSSIDVYIAQKSS